MAQTSDAPIAIEIDRAEGIYMYDLSGKSYMDLISGISVSSLGHRHPAVVEAIKDQLDHYLHLMVYGEYIQSPQVKLAELLTSQLSPKLDSVYFVNSGSEAIEGAMKLAKRASGRYEIIAFNHAYHGHTQGAMSIMGGESWKQNFRPLLPGIKFLDYNHIGQLHEISDHTACVIVEVVQGEGGVIPALPGFLESIRQRCNETGTLLIFDEVQTGFGRTGTLFAHQGVGVIPDILVLAKAMGAGMPIGAFVSSKERMALFMNNPPLGHITTFGGHPVSAAAALAGLKVLLNKDYIADVHRKSELFRTLLADNVVIKEIRSAGLMIALDLKNPAFVKKTIASCLEKGLIVDWFLFDDGAIRLAPPLIITEEEIRSACSILNEALLSCKL